MANALNHNLEMSDVLQVSKLKKHVQITISNMQEQGEDMQVTGNQLPPQGHTLRTDLMIKGMKVFTDAAWKTKKAPGLPSATGIGIFIQVQEDDRSAMVMIQASIPTAPSVLQAEAEALLAAARITSALHLRGHTFLMDSIILASAAETNLRTLEEVPWEIRRIIAEYKNLTRFSPAPSYHIKRDINGVAHNCAHQALRQTLSRPIFSCSSSAHRFLDCPILYAVQQMQISNLILHVVHCL
jgi:hypothetical protein